MGYELMGRLHAALLGLRDTRGQGTVEYVGLILLLAVILAGVVKVAQGGKHGGDIASTVVGELKQAIKQVGGK